MLSKSAVVSTNYKKHLVFTESARKAWKLILENLSTDSKVLLPSYIGVTDREGSGIFDPITELGLEYKFYNLNDDLSIAYEEIENQLNKNNFDVILLVHYFGFKIQNIDSISKLCKSNGIIVVEDCAHMYTYNLNEISDVGTFGDFCFYSLHNNVPFKMGGLLVQNNIKLNKVDQLSDLNIGYNVINYDAKSIAIKRIENFNFLHQLMSSIEGVSPLKSLDIGDIPHTYPIIICDGLREKLYFKLINQNIPVIALYYRLINPLLQEQFKVMQFISNNILNLPIHQDIEKKDLLIIADLIKELIIELKL